VIAVLRVTSDVKKPVLLL